MNRTRIYVFLGSANSLTDFMSSMDTANLFAKGEYMVIYVDMMVYSERYAPVFNICTIFPLIRFRFPYAARRKSICGKWIKSIA